ncbi:MAG: methionyl-tRNA formyltransferase [Rhodospirillaceae bacterium]|nr:methionyl-tRNA formyltransferase [Rhodospirillaceae bacterium]MBT6118103.1 methionyl-tRNA formyltransferase [Rhodospirillaceae bacterium]
MAPLKLAFMGTPDFAVPSLAALAEAGHEVAAVYSQPPRAAGRGKKAWPSPVQRWAEARGLPVRTPASLCDEAEQAAFADLALDAAVVVAYGLILPKPILASPRLGCVNVHASLLPRWRGAAPIQRAILAGDRETGITIMRMEEGLDTGPMLAAQATPIEEEDTAGSLHDRLAEMGAALLVATLDRLAAGDTAQAAQDDALATYAAKIEKAEARIDWGASAEAIRRQVRAFAPVPGAFFDLAGYRVKLLAAASEAGAGAPGTVLDDGLLVACGEGALRLLRLQREGKAAMEVEAFLRGRPVPKGTMLAQG